MSFREEERLMIRWCPGCKAYRHRGENACDCVEGHCPVCESAMKMAKPKDANEAAKS